MYACTTHYPHFTSFFLFLFPLCQDILYEFGSQPSDLFQTKDIWSRRPQEFNKIKCISFLFNSASIWSLFRRAYSAMRPTVVPPSNHVRVQTEGVVVTLPPRLSITHLSRYRLWHWSSDWRDLHDRWPPSECGWLASVYFIAKHFGHLHSNRYISRNLFCLSIHGIDSSIYEMHNSSPGLMSFMAIMATL